MTKKKQILLGLGAGFILLVILGGIKFFQIRAAIAQHAAMGQPKEAVTTTITKEQIWRNNVDAVGSLSAVNGAILSAETAGEVTAINFESGDFVKAGTVLVQLNIEVEAAQLKGAKAVLKQSEQALKRAEVLRSRNANSIADLDSAIATSAEAAANVEALKASIDKKTIVAPFDGFTGVRKVNVGQYVAEGAEVVPLFDMASLYVDFELPQTYVNSIKRGSKIEITRDNFEKAFTGEVQSSDPNIDSATRNYSLRAKVKNENSILRPGMFVDVKIDSGTSQNIVPVPQSSISYAPYGNSVWLVETSKNEAGEQIKSVTQQFVKLGEKKGDLVAVLSGLKPGQEIVTSGTFKLRPGVNIVINNSVTPSESANPNPPNT